MLRYLTLISVMLITVSGFSQYPGQTVQKDGVYRNLKVTGILDAPFSFSGSAAAASGFMRSSDVTSNDNSITLTKTSPNKVDFSANIPILKTILQAQGFVINESLIAGTGLYITTGPDGSAEIGIQSLTTDKGIASVTGDSTTPEAYVHLKPYLSSGVTGDLASIHVSDDVVAGDPPQGTGQGDLHLRVQNGNKIIMGTTGMKDAVAIGGAEVTVNNALDVNVGDISATNINVTGNAVMSNLSMGSITATDTNLDSFLMGGLLVGGDARFRDELINMNYDNSEPAGYEDFGGLYGFSILRSAGFDLELVWDSYTGKWSATDATGSRQPIVLDNDPRLTGGSAISYLNELLDVDTVTNPPVVNNTLVWNGSNWVPGVIESFSATAAEAAGFPKNDDILEGTDVTVTPSAPNKATIGLSSNVPRLNGTNNFTGSVTLPSNLQIGNAAVNGVTDINVGREGVLTFDDTEGPFFNFNDASILAGTITADIYNGNYYGDGSGLQNLSAGNLTGSINDARLSSNIPRLNTVNTFSNTVNVPTLNVTGKLIQPTEQVFEVAPDGSREFTTIQAALAAATNAAVDKIILLYPGTYTLADGVQLNLSVARTHLRGTSRDGVKIVGGMPQGDNVAGGLIHVSAANCSVENLTAHNHTKIGNTWETHACVLKVSATGFKGRELTLEAFTNHVASPPNNGSASDTIAVAAGGTGALFENCHIIGWNDQFSVGAQDVTLKNSTIESRASLLSPTRAIWISGDTDWTVVGPASLLLSDVLVKNFQRYFYLGRADVVAQNLHAHPNTPNMFYDAGEVGSLKLDNVSGSLGDGPWTNKTITYSDVTGPLISNSLHIPRNTDFSLGPEVADDNPLFSYKSGTNLFEFRDGFGNPAPVIMSGSSIVDIPAGNITGSINISQIPTIPTSKGGTGLTAIGTSGQVLRVNAGATGLEWGSMATGTAWGSITGTLSAQADLNTALSGKAALVHDHDSRYYTESEVDSALAGKSSTSHSHSLSGLDDTTIPVFPNDGEVLTWDSATNNWLAKPTPIPPSTAWGSITGTLSAQTDLNNAFLAKQDADSDLTALAGLASTGIIARTGTGAVAARTITGTANLITVTNNNGVSGNPTITVGANVARRDVANTFAANQTVNGTLAATTLTGAGSGITGLTKGQVGLGNVDNTSDANKPVSTAVSSALGLKANIESPTFTGTVTAPTLDVTTKFIQPTAQVFEVAADGSREYTTIQAAVAAATDPNIDKTILVYPGVYNLPDETGILVSVPKTHIKGVSRDNVIIQGSVFLGDVTQGYWQGVVMVKANDCSVRNVTIQNTSKLSWRVNYKANTLMIGEMSGAITQVPITNIRVDNVKLLGKTAAGVSGSNGWSYDVLWICQNARDVLITNSEVQGWSDIVSWSGSGVMKDSVVINQNTLGARGAFFWAARRILDSSHNPKVTLKNISTRGRIWTYVVIGGYTELTMIDVNNLDENAYIGDYFVTSADAENANNTVYIGGSVLGKPPATHPDGITTLTYLPNVSAGNVYGTLSDSLLSSNIPKLNSANVFTGALTATSFTGSGSGLTNLSAGNLTGTIADARIPSSIARTASPTFTGTVTGGVFSGSGSGLTNLNASNLASGTVPDARLSAAGQDAIAKRHSQNTDTGTVNFSFNVGSDDDSATLLFGKPSGAEFTQGSIAYDGYGNFSYTAGWNLANVIADVFYGSGAGLTNLQSASLVGTINDSLLSGNIARTNNPTFTGTVTAGSFSGSGASLTNLPAGNLTGTIDVARIPTTIARLASPTFTGTATAPTFSSTGALSTFGDSTNEGLRIGNSMDFIGTGSGTAYVRGSTLNGTTVARFSGNGTGGTFYEVFATDVTNGFTNYSRLKIGARNNTTPYVISSDAAGTGPAKPLAIFADRTASDETGNQLYLARTGEVGVGKIPTSGVKLDVEGTLVSKAVTANAEGITNHVFSQGASEKLRVDSSGIKVTGATATGGMVVPYKAISGNYTVLTSDYYIQVAATYGPFTITMPQNAPVGQIYRFHIDPANTSNNITWDAGSGGFMSMAYAVYAQTATLDVTFRRRNYDMIQIAPKIWQISTFQN